MPRILCLDSNYEETAQMLQHVRRKLTNGVRTCFQRNALPPKEPSFINGYYDFATIEKCTPAAALILASEYDRARSIIDWSIPIVNQERWSPSVVATLDEIGFFDLLAIEHEPAAKSSDAIEIVKFRTGEAVGRAEADGLITALADMILADVDEKTENAIIAARMQLFGALVEATENTRIHAYDERTWGFTVPRWWMTGAVDKGSRHLNIVVYDQGRSIPATLPEWDSYGWIAARLARFRRFTSAAGVGHTDEDAAKIRLAMKMPRSSTLLSNRGKGLPAFKAVIDACRKGKLRIVSRCGEFLYETGDRPRSTLLNTPLTGTLVEWDLWL